MKMSKIQEICELEGLKTRSYSGRGMYGASCLGVDVSREKELIRALVEHVDDENREEVQEAIGLMTVDSMGRDIIVYFPGIKYVDELEPFEDEEGDGEEDAA
jgi:hypothetical protein